MRSAAARLFRIGCAMAISLATLSCGGNTVGASSGGGPVTPAANVVSVLVNGGPNAPASPAINTLYTTVTVCVPGTTNCQTIGGIQVDTGSYGLRLLPVLSLSLPINTSSNGASLFECTVFIDGYSWGPVSRVDVQISGETAHSVPVQLIGDSRSPAVPADCSMGLMAEDTVKQFGANGILGIGPLVQDCGSACVSAVTPIPATYYSCTQAACAATNVPLTSQVQNPVPLFPTDNNGTIIVLPSVAASGATSVAGSLIFGIDTQSNNQSGSQTVLTLNQGVFITTIFNGHTFNSSFIDSGSNGIFFTDSNIVLCPSPNSSFYCPASPLTLSATLQGMNGTSVTESFSVTNLDAVAPTVTALPGLAGPMAGNFDWGLPFFYNRRVATAITGFTTSAGTGPYIAF